MCLLGRFDDDVISGKYLNKIHLINIEMKVYETLYEKLFMIYAQENPEELLKLSIDSTFVQNVLCTDCYDRNQHYYNKTGLKIQTMCDAIGTPLRFFLTSAVENDTLSAIKLITECPTEYTEKAERILYDTGYTTTIVTK